jgi:ankyrin repeat protein
MLAASNGHEAAMKVLLQKGADDTVQDEVSE